MKKSDLRKFQEGSAELVVAHAKWQKSRGRQPSMSFEGELNPLKALELAEQSIPGDYPNWRETVLIWDVSWDGYNEILIYLHKNKPAIRVPWKEIRFKVKPDHGQDPKIQPWYEPKTKTMWWNSAWECKNCETTKAKRLTDQQKFATELKEGKLIVYYLWTSDRSRATSVSIEKEIWINISGKGNGLGDGVRYPVFHVYNRADPSKAATPDSGCRVTPRDKPFLSFAAAMTVASQHATEALASGKWVNLK